MHASEFVHSILTNKIPTDVGRFPLILKVNAQPMRIYMFINTYL